MFRLRLPLSFSRQESLTGHCWPRRRRLTRGGHWSVVRCRSLRSVQATGGALPTPGNARLGLHSETMPRLKTVLYVHFQDNFLGRRCKVLKLKWRNAGNNTKGERTPHPAVSGLPKSRNPRNPLNMRNPPA